MNYYKEQSKQIEKLRDELNERYAHTEFKFIASFAVTTNSVYLKMIRKDGVLPIIQLRLSDHAEPSYKREADIHIDANVQNFESKLERFVNRVKFWINPELKEDIKQTLLDNLQDKANQDFSGLSVNHKHFGEGILKDIEVKMNGRVKAVAVVDFAEHEYKRVMLNYQDLIGNDGNAILPEVRELEQLG